MAVCGSTHKTLKNGLRYRVVEATAAEDTTVCGSLKLECVDDANEPRGEPFTLDAAEAARFLRLTHALCYYTVQARTIHGPLRLAQTDHKHFTLRHLIVGLGRAPEGGVVEVE